MAARFLDELHAGAHAELGVDMGEVRLHRARRDEKPRADVLIAQPFLDSRAAQNAATATALWQLSEELTATTFPL